jgi:hypothetical protein
VAGSAAKAVALLLSVVLVFGAAMAPGTPARGR